MSVDPSIIVPLVGIDFDSSRALPGSPGVPVQMLLIGQKTAAGTITKESLTRVFGADEVGQLTGVGSVLHRMAIKTYAENKTVPVYVIALDDAVGSAAATQLLDLTGTATENGEIDLYINGERLAIGVTSGDTAAVIGVAIESAINDDDSLPVTAVYNADPANTITITAKNKGIAAGDMDVRFNYNVGEKIPAGVVLTIGTYTAGTVDPDIQDAIDAIGNSWFQVITAPYNDATNLTAIEVYLASQDGSLVMRDSMYYFARKDTRAGQITFATNSDRNSKSVVMIDAQSRPSANCEVAAAVAAATAVSVRIDPAIPLHRITLSGLLPISEGDRYELTERNQLAENGIATLTDDNGVQTESTVTMYLKNSAGARDLSYQFQNTLYILQRLRYTLRNWFLTKYPRAKLADNIDRVASGQQIITPAVAKGDCVAWFLTEMRAGQVENIDQFKSELVVERDQSNVNRLNFLLPPDLINQFIVGSMDIQFRLQS